jgi:hypothetical protein
VLPDTVRDVADAVVRVVCPDTPRVPPTPRRNAGDVDPTPTLPLERMVKNEEPVEDATLNGLRLPAPCTFRLNDDEEALTPRTDPLSIIVDVPSVVGVSQRVA